MHDAILSPLFHYSKTYKFHCVDFNEDCISQEIYKVHTNFECPYTNSIVIDAISRRPWCTVHLDLPQSNHGVFQICDFENILWDPVLEYRNYASSYLVRKGVSRKAQFALQIKRYCSKHSNSILSNSFPYTIILDIWNAFEDLKIDFGNGLSTSFDNFQMPQTSLRQRIEWCLEFEKEAFEKASNQLWILKPSVTNKGVGISLVRDWNDVLDALEYDSEIREWVLQKYISNPLLIQKKKFHFRVYILCIGALKVYVFDQILMLFAAKRYDLKDVTDIYQHLTNTARGTECNGFNEEESIKLLDDLTFHLQDEYGFTRWRAEEAVRAIRTSIYAITRLSSQSTKLPVFVTDKKSIERLLELFQAYENEYTIFCPMSNCFELYGADFLLDDALKLHLLELNPGPDFKQTGQRLRQVIVELWEQTCQLLFDRDIFDINSTTSTIKVNNGNNLDTQNRSSSNSSIVENEPSDIRVTRDFMKVYDKEWSAAKLRGGMSLK